ncbi:MAG: hypothetical protein RSD88_02695 [Anaerovoracaceae bacterium]
MVKDFAEGVTAPPFHPRCRTTTMPAVDDEWMEGATRIARDADGKTYSVPADMKYPEWKKEYVVVQEKMQNTDESGIINRAKSIDALKSFGTPRSKDLTVEAVEAELLTSPVGRETIKYIQGSDVSIQLLSGISKPDGRRGEQDGKYITIYLDHIKNTRVAAQTIIHEMTHYYYDIGRCQWAEAVCFAKEKMHIENRSNLTFAEKRYVVKLAQDNYPEYNWKKGGYKGGRKL